MLVLRGLEEVAARVQSAELWPTFPVLTVR